MSTPIAGVAKVLKVMGQDLDIKAQVGAISVHYQKCMVALHAVVAICVSIIFDISKKN